jgi:HAD superfamily hydrolase (TIGR01509 family)
MNELNAITPLPREGIGGGVVRAILFDMDGVLFDSMPNHAYAWSHAMTDFGLKMEPEEVYMNEGRTGKGTINILSNRYWGRDATDEEVQRIYDAKSALFNSLPEARPMPGAIDLLYKVRAQGLMRVIVTGSATHALLDRLNAAFPDLFTPELMVTAFDVHQGKPNPEPYLMGLKKANISASEAIVVENAPLGVQAARAAGIFTIAVNTGPLKDEVLKEAGADLVLPSMQYLADNWEQVYNNHK